MCVTYVSSSGEVFYQCDGPGHRQLTELEHLFLAPDKVRLQLYLVTMSLIICSSFSLFFVNRKKGKFQFCVHEI